MNTTCQSRVQFGFPVLLISSRCGLICRILACVFLFQNVVRSQVSLTDSTAVSWDDTSVMGAFGEPVDVVFGGLRFLNPAVSYSIRYGNGIPSQFGRGESSFIQTLSPRVGVRFAESFYLAYSPTFIWYSSDDLEDVVQHKASARGSTMVGDLSLRGQQSYSRTKSPLVETAAATEQTSWRTSLSASRPLGERFSANLDMNYTDRETRLYNDVETYGAMFWLRGKAGVSLDYGLGAGGELRKINPGADLDSTQLRGEVNWLIGEKLRISFNAGADYSDFEGAGGVVNPVYSISARYSPTATTSLVTSMHRSVDASIFSNRLVEADRYSVYVNQRLLGKLVVGLGLSTSNTEYKERSNIEGAATRVDERWAFNAQLSSPVAQRIAVSAFFQASENKSDQANYTFRTEVVGFTLSWAL